MKPKVESLVDEIVKCLPMTFVMIPGFRERAAALIQKMLDGGFQIIPPGARTPDTGFAHELVEIDAGSVFCPHCGKHKPALGFTGAHCEVQGMGVIATLTIFCGECRAILNVFASPAGPPTGKVQ
jgi:hypothetical protein